MAVIKVQKIPRKTESALETVARFCFYFQQYTFQEARKLPFKYINLMLTVARKEYAMKMHDLTQAISAPNTPKGIGVKKMLKYFKDMGEQ